MRTVNTTEARENLVELLTAAEQGEEIVIVRRGRPVARLVAIDKRTTDFVDRSELRSDIPPMRHSAGWTVRQLRDDERH